MKVFSSKHAALKVDVLWDHKIYCLQAHPCSFQPGNFTGGGSEGVNALFDSNRCWVDSIENGCFTQQPKYFDITTSQFSTF